MNDKQQVDACYGGELYHNTGEPVDAFCARCVEQAGVLLLPSTVYDHPPSVDKVVWAGCTMGWFCNVCRFCVLLVGTVCDKDGVS